MLVVFSTPESVTCGKSLIDMCKVAGVGHIVFTALDLVPNGEGSDHPGGQSTSLFEPDTKHYQAYSEILIIVLSYIKQTYTGHAEHEDRPHGAHHHLHWTILYPGWKFSKLITLDLFSKVPISKLPTGSREPDAAKELEKNVSRKEGEPAARLTDDDGEEWLLRVPLPDETKIPGYAVEQLGLWVKAAFLNHKKFRGEPIRHTLLKQHSNYLIFDRKHHPSLLHHGYTSRDGRCSFQNGGKASADVGIDTRGILLWRF